MTVDIRTRQQLWKDMAGNLVEKSAELANTYDMPLSEPTKKPGTSDTAEKSKGGAIEKTATPMNPLDAAAQFRGAIDEAGAYHGGQEDLSPEMQAHLIDLVQRRAREEAGGARNMAAYSEAHPVLSKGQKALSGALMGAGAGVGTGAYLRGTPAAMGLGAAGGAALGGLGGLLADTSTAEHEAKAGRLEGAEASLDPEVLSAMIERSGHRQGGAPPRKEPVPELLAPTPAPPPQPPPQMFGPQGLDIRIAVPLMAAMQQQQAQQMNQKHASAEPEEDLLKEAFLVGVNHGEVPPDDNEDKPTKGEQPASLPQAKSMSPTVDVSSKDPPKETKRKEAEFYAMPSIERFPLDGYDQVKKAAAYFDEWKKEMPPAMRREYCQNMVKRASVLGIAVSEDAACYASSKYASQEHIDICLDARRSILTDKKELELLNKLASTRQQLPPDMYAECLAQFDKLACLEQHYGADVPDPYISTFEKAAVKTESDPGPEESILIGTEYTTKRQLFELSKRGNRAVCLRFGKEFAKEFANDPMAIFNSLPRDQKLVLMHLANNNQSNVTSASTS